MTQRSLFLAVVLATVTPSLALAQETAPARFDLAAALADGAEPLTAERAASMAVARSPRLDAARLTVTAAEASVHAATAALVPRLDLGGRYAHVDGFPDGQIQAGPGLAITIHIPRDQFAATARLSVPITDMIFAALPAMEGAESRVRAEHYRIDATEADVALTASEAFYRYVEARGVAAVAGSARDQAAATRDQIVRYAEAGILGPADRAAAEARVAQAEEALARSDAAVLVSGAALSILLGTPPEQRFQVAGAIPSEAPTLPGSLDALETSALDRRPEIRAMRESIAAQRRLRDATLATGYPHLGIYGYAEYSSPNQRVFPLTTTPYPSYELGAQLTWSPSDTATAVFHADEQAAQIAVAEDQLHIVEDGVRLEIRQAFAELRTAERSLEAARVSAEAAEEAYRTQAAALAAGESILNDLLLADARATEARLADLRARIAANLARARLGHAIGEGHTD
jgi:outer membrane protein